jgi:hypothetical protein
MAENFRLKENAVVGAQEPFRASRGTETTLRIADKGSLPALLTSGKEPLG